MNIKEMYIQILLKTIKLELNLKNLFLMSMNLINKAQQSKLILIEIIKQFPLIS